MELSIKLQRIEQILATNPNFREDIDTNSIDSVLISYFIDKLDKNEFEKHKTDLKELIILDYHSDSKNLSLRKNRLDISLNFAANKYLGLIVNNGVSDEIRHARNKNDLKGIIFIDNLVSDINDDSESIIKKCEFLEDYKKEIQRFTKSSSRLKQLHKKAKDIAGSSSFSLKSIQDMKEASDSLAGCSQEYKTITKNPEMVKQIEEARERYSGLKGCLDSWSVKLREYLENELNSINISPLYISNQTTRLNEIKQKYKAAGMKSQELDQKLSQLFVIEDKINMRLHASYRENPNLLYRFRKKLAYAAAGLIFLISAGVYTGTKPEAHIGHSRMTTIILDNKLISSDMKQDGNIKEYVEETKEKYESRFADLKQMFTKAGTIEEYESTQKQLDNLKAEIKGFMNSEIYKRYNGGKHD